MWPETAGIGEMDKGVPKFQEQGVSPEAGECSHDYAHTTHKCIYTCCRTTNTQTGWHIHRAHLTTTGP